MSRLKVRTLRDSVPTPIVATSVGTAWAQIVGARDFSVPDENNRFPNRDPLDATRAIRAGMIEFMADLKARNTSADTRWIEFGEILEGETTVRPWHGRYTVPAGATVLVPMRGESLVKIDPASANGARLMARAEVSGAFIVRGSATELGFDTYEVQP